MPNMARKRHIHLHLTIPIQPGSSVHFTIGDDGHFTATSTNGEPSTSTAAASDSASSDGTLTGASLEAAIHRLGDPGGPARTPVPSPRTCARWGTSTFRPRAPREGHPRTISGPSIRRAAPPRWPTSRRPTSNSPRSPCNWYRNWPRCPAPRAEFGGEVLLRQERQVGPGRGQAVHGAKQESEGLTKREPTGFRSRTPRGSSKGPGAFGSLPRAGRHPFAALRQCLVANVMPRTRLVDLMSRAGGVGTLGAGSHRYAPYPGNRFAPSAAP